MKDKINIYMYLASLLGGESLPVTCNPTTSRSAKVQPKSSPQKPLPKVMNAKHLSGGKRSKDAIDMKNTTEAQEIYKPPVGSKLKLVGFSYVGLP